MSIEQLEGKVVELTGELGLARGEAERLFRLWMSAMSAEIIEWAPKSVTSMVTRHADVTSRLDAAGKLKVLKEDVTNALAKIPAALDTLASDDSLWPHRAGRKESDDDRSFSGYHSEPPKRILDALYKRVVDGTFGKVLTAAGYPRSSWRHGSDHGYGYDDHFKPSDALQGPLKAYGKACEEVRRLSSALKSAVDTRDRAKAADAWSKA
jgi:hypothetical protein